MAPEELTDESTEKSTDMPTEEPTEEPTDEPTEEPTDEPSLEILMTTTHSAPTRAFMPPAVWGDKATGELADEVRSAFDGSNTQRLDLLLLEAAPLSARSAEEP